MATADEYAEWIVKNKSLKGTPDFNTVAKAYEEAKAAESAPASTLKIVTSAPYKAIAGAADIFLTAPQNIANLAKMGYGVAATEMGRPDLAPEVTAPNQPTSELFQRIGLIEPVQGKTTPFQRGLDVAIQGATGALMGSGPAIRAAAPTLMGQTRAAGRWLLWVAVLGLLGKLLLK